MTTGRINQVTFLSERDLLSDRRELVRRVLVHTKGAEASWRGFRQTSESVLVRLVTGLFGFSETSTTLVIVQSSIAERLNQSRGFPKNNAFCKLSYNRQALQ